MRLFNKLKKKEIKKEEFPFTIQSPIKGEVIDIKKTNDLLFSQEALGKGVGILAEDDVIVAPMSGVIQTFFPTKHAIGIRTDEGVELLIHVGIDTVELNGKYFEALKKQGDRVTRSEPLLHVDFDGIKKSHYDPTVMLVITNIQEYPTIRIFEGRKETSEVVIEIEK